MTHFELCEKVAKWAVKKNDVVLFDYQSFATGEFPDCLAFDGSVSKLYEVKISRSDFLADLKKECRKTSLKQFERSYFWVSRPDNVEMEQKRREYFSQKTIIAKEMEYPHLGKYRYYVCPENLIIPDETGCWGLIWLTKRGFSERKRSLEFRRSLFEENSLLVNAIRKERNVENKKLLVREY